jgi:hypothetical protein
MRFGLWLRATKRTLYEAHARWGILGFAGLALCVLATAIAVSWDLQAWRELRYLRAQILVAQRASGHEISSSGQVMSSRAPPASEDQFAALTDVPGIFSEIVQHARDKSIPINQADYRYSPATATSPGSYEMACHLRSRYLPMRQFVQDLLNDEPRIALRELSFAREAPAQPELDTHMRLVVFVRPGAQ